MGGGSWVLRWGGVSRPSSLFQEGIKQTASPDGMVSFKRHSLIVPKIVVARLGTQSLTAPARKNLLQEVSLSTQEVLWSCIQESAYPIQKHEEKPHHRSGNSGHASDTQLWVHKVPDSEVKQEIPCVFDKCST